MTIYLDIVLLENILMNYMILYTTGRILKITNKVRNLLLASTLGGVYAVMAVTTALEIYANLFLKIILSVMMVYIAFRAERGRKLLKQIIWFYFISFVFGGTAFALLYFVKPENILMKNGALIGTYPIKIAILGAILGFLMIQIATRGIKNKMSKKDLFCDIQMEIEEKFLKVKAMIDTGNLVKEPITGLPVMIIERTALENIIPKRILDNTEKIMNGDFKEIEDQYAIRLRVIPFTSLGKQNGLLLGMTVENVTVQTEENEIKIKNSIIGMYDKPLSKSGAYHALIGLDMLEGGTNEFIANHKT